MTPGAGSSAGKRGRGRGDGSGRAGSTGGRGGGTAGRGGGTAGRGGNASDRDRSTGSARGGGRTDRARGRRTDGQERAIPVRPSRARALAPADQLAPSSRSGGNRRSRTEGPELGGQQVEGRHAVRELLAAHRRPIREVWLADGLDPTPILEEIAALAVTASIPVRTVNSARLRQVASTDAPQGVVAFAEPLPEADLDDMVTSRPGSPPPFLVVVDGVTDPHNLGALLRTAQCAGATGAVLPRHRSAHVTATVAKAAAGAIEYLPLCVVPGIPSALARLADAGVWTVGLDAGAPQPLWGMSVATEPIAIVLGAEGAGLSRLAKARCQLLVAIPQAGPLASLNVAAAGALACFEVSRARSVGASDS